ncbi:ABC transporter B family member 15 [Morus notabilis]|uniref:ABC transporter B family member 15 n=1 Tax=Morus notabilis TaxID=981085 RepID=W9QXA9_9ROSA|nr:ABC transporter B family member 15 [Morus notabilis]
MENGQVKEAGSHNELIQEENGIYASLVRLQRMDIEKDHKEKNFRSPSRSNKDFNDNMHECRLGLSKSNLTDTVTASSISRVRTNNDSNDPKSPTASFWRLLGLNKPEWKQATLGCLSAIIFGAMQPLYAVSMGTTISVYFLTDHDEIKERIRSSALWFLGLTIVSFLVNISQHYSFAYMGEYLTKRIRERMFAKILTFEVGWFDRDENSSGVICSTLAKDPNVVRSLVGDRMSLLVQATSAVIIAWTLGLVIA